MLLTAWDVQYPQDVFPSLWKELSHHKDKMILIEPIYKEIDPISGYDKKNLTPQEIEKKYPLNSWIKTNLNPPIKVQQDVELESLQLEKKYEIEKGSKGVNQNDITLIVYAKINNKTVVTLEKDQTKNPPGKKKNYKIPLVCKEENVQCMNFVDMLKHLNIKI